MNKEELEKFKRIKKLVSEGKRRFKERNDRDYVADLFELGVTEEEAWNTILYLKPNGFFRDDFYDATGSKNALPFHWMVNGIKTYIKLDIEYDHGEETVCWSFHKDRR